MLRWCSKLKQKIRDLCGSRVLMRQNGHCVLEQITGNCYSSGIFSSSVSSAPWSWPGINLFWREAVPTEPDKDQRPTYQVKVSSNRRRAYIVEKGFLVRAVTVGRTRTHAVMCGADLQMRGLIVHRSTFSFLPRAGSAT